jgi:hypothetical protein
VDGDKEEMRKLQNSRPQFANISSNSRESSGIPSVELSYFKYPN